MPATPRRRPAEASDADPSAVRAVLLDLLAVAMIVVGVPALLVGSYLHSLGAGIAVTGALVAGGGFALGRRSR